MMLGLISSACTAAPFWDSSMCTLPSARLNVTTWLSMPLKEGSPMLVSSEDVDSRNSVPLASALLLTYS